MKNISINYSILLTTVFVFAGVFGSFNVSAQSYFGNGIVEVGDTITLSIDKGWNLVDISTIDYLPFNSSELKENTNTLEVYMFNAFSQEFTKIYTPGSPSLDFNDVQEYNGNEEGVEYFPGVSMFVYSGKKFNYQIKIKKNSSSEFLDFSPENINLRKGWNLTSANTSFLGKSLDDIKGNCDISRAYYFDSEDQRWEDWNLDEVFKNRHLTDSSGSNIAIGLLVRVGIKSGNYCSFEGESKSNQTSTPLPKLPN